MINEVLKHNDHNEHGDFQHTVLQQGDFENQLAEKVLDCAFKIHRHYGPGLLESAYEKILVYELHKNCGLKVEAQKDLPIVHEGLLIDCGYRIDLMVEGKLIVELKACEKLLPVHEAQLLTYLRLAGVRLGLLINFNNRMLKDGIKRLVV